MAGRREPVRRAGPEAPLKESELRRRVKPRAALKKLKAADIHFTLMGMGSPKLTHRVRKRAKATIGRPATVPKSGGGAQIDITLAAGELGTRVFPPAIKGTRLAVPKLTAAMRAQARAGLPALDGYLPDHLPLQPVPPRLGRALKRRPFMNTLTRPNKTRRIATTVFMPEDRYIFSDTAFPWCTVGRVDTGGGVASGVLVGPRHLLTVSHTIVWGAGNSAGWVRFRPSYFDGNAPFGEAWATNWYAYKKVVGPGIDQDEGRQDYAVLVLNQRIGNLCGWMGSRTYSESWDGGAYWRHIGYPGDMAGAERPSYERNISLDGRDSSSHRELWHQGDVWPGQSGGPFFAWWNSEAWPRVVGVQSWENSQRNGGSGGGRMVDLIIRARNDFP